MHKLHGFDAYTITATDRVTQATFVPERGGAGCSIKMLGIDGPRELLHLHDFFWDKKIERLPGGWPFCFPVCARLERQNQYGTYLYDGKLYQLAIHGFSWNRPWQVDQYTRNSLTLSLQYDVDTLEQYPFKFYLQLHYIIEPNQLICFQEYKNLDTKTMPYYAGFHPYFLTPAVQAGKEKVMLHYQPLRRFKYNEKLTDLIGEQEVFPTPISISDPQINEQLTKVGDNKQITLHYPDGDVIQMVAEGVEDKDLFPYIQLYTMADRPFICVEPWMGFPNALNTVLGVRWLQAGQSEHGKLILSLLS